MLMTQTMTELAESSCAGSFAAGPWLYLACNFGPSQSHFGLPAAYLGRIVLSIAVCTLGGPLAFHTAQGRKVSEP